MGKITLMSLAG